ncbi:phosphonate ABC transporter ATP-binding protein [Citricoccus nitrophenolicus]|uniref:phosphonate ABC transporter ATP-binding protein n=1 Tax=Citricoccus nitrophenolicus TaxID=863575 RepID=UPI0039B47550
MTLEKPAAETAQRSPSITLDGVVKRFGDNTVLHGVDLQIHPGEFIALVGPSGAGKSTLLRLLNGSHSPTEGHVRVLGREPAGCSRRELRRLRTEIGFVFQQFGLVGRLTALENVLMGALGSLSMPRYGITTYPKQLRERAVENLERVGLVDQRFQRCDTLSGGQQQRVAIARMLMQDARLVLADEPVASLDPAASISVLETLKKLSAEDGFTVVCSLHQVDLALEVSDRIVAVRDGQFILDKETHTTDEPEIRAIYQAHRGA